MPVFAKWEDIYQTAEKLSQSQHEPGIVNQTCFYTVHAIILYTALTKKCIILYWDNSVPLYDIIYLPRKVDTVPQFSGKSALAGESSLARLLAT